jgi:hypothetical protein
MKTPFLNKAVALAGLTLGLYSGVASADCFMGEGLGYVSGYPWEAGRFVRQGGPFSREPEIRTGMTVPLFVEKKPGSHRKWTLALERGGKVLDWFKSSPSEKSRFLKGDLASLVKEVTFLQLVSDILPDGSERPVGVSTPIRTAYMVPVLVGQKFAELHGACPRMSQPMSAPPPMRGGQRERSAHLDESCVFTVKNRDIKNRGKPDQEHEQNAILFMLDSGSGQTLFIDREMKNVRNEAGQRAFSKAQVSEYLDMLHAAVLASIEKLALGESTDPSLHADDRVLAEKFFKCREKRSVDGIDEAEFSKRVFGK